MVIFYSALFFVEMPRLERTVQKVSHNARSAQTLMEQERRKGGETLIAPTADAAELREDISIFTTFAERSCDPASCLIA